MKNCTYDDDDDPSLFEIPISRQTKKNKNIPLELQALVGMGLLADHSTVEAEQEEPWQDQAEGRSGSEEDRLG